MRTHLFLWSFSLQTFIPFDNNKCVWCSIFDSNYISRYGERHIPIEMTQKVWMRRQLIQYSKMQIKYPELKYFCTPISWGERISLRIYCVWTIVSLTLKHFFQGGWIWKIVWGIRMRQWTCNQDRLIISTIRIWIDRS